MGSQLNRLVVSDEGIALIKQFEGYRDRAYVCAGGKVTIGYGTTKNVKMGMTCTEEQAHRWLIDDLVGIAQCFEKYISVQLKQNQIDALASWTYNLGIGNLLKSTLLKKLNAGKFDDIPDEIRKWKYVINQNEKRPLLVARRNAEAELFARV